MTIQLLNDRYQVIRTLGAGGFGETYLAEDTYMPSQRKCVVKQLRPIQNNPQIYQLVQERFQREAAILEELGGATDQIPGLYAYFIADGQFYLVQEWIEGDTLTARLQKQGLFTESAIQELLVNLLPVLEYVHAKHIVHRDIKPDNIILRHRDGKPVLIDFGAVRESMGTVLNSQGNPTSSIVIGTPGYMPSEQAAGRPVYSSDLYSLGLTAIYLLTGRQPQTLEIDSQSGEIVWRQHASQISQVLASVLDRAIAYHPRDRYSTARAMLDNLPSINNPLPPTQPYFAPPPVVSAPPQPTVPVVPQVSVSSNNQKGILFGSVIAGVLIGGSVIAGWVFTRPSQPIANQNVTPIATPSPVTPIATPSPVTPIATPSPVTPIATPSPVTPTATPSPVTPIVTRPPVVPSPIQQINSSPTPVDINTTENNYFWVSEQALTDADLDGKDGYTLDIMRNTIFARHGRRFNNQGLQDYFNNQPWYNPIYSPTEFPPKLLTRLEQRNADYIAAYQKRYNLRHFK